IHEQADWLHERRQLSQQRRSVARIDVARRLRIEIDADGVGAERRRRPGVVHRRDAADFDAQASHLTAMVPDPVTANNPFSDASQKRLSFAQILHSSSAVPYNFMSS